jgi:hypothetical protein
VHVEPIAVLAEAEGGTEVVEGLDLGLEIGADGRLQHLIFADGVQSLTLEGVEEPHRGDVVPAGLDPGFQFGGAVEQAEAQCTAGVEPPVGAALGLLELVAVDGVVEPPGEVRGQFQAGPDQVGIDPVPGLALLLLELQGEAGAVGLPSVAGVQGSEPAEPISSVQKFL